MLKDSIKIEFKYEDLLGNITESKVERTNSANDDTFDSEFDALIDTYKGFLVSCGFTEELINTRIK